MNESNDPALPAPESNNPSEPPAATPAPPDPVENAGFVAPAVQVGEALRRFFACNPLYLVSAALLLYGFYLVSADRSFFTTEVSQLSFNLGSLQLYEAIVVATAIFLAGRAIWYDSTLLVGLENLLVLVPFILISQAALINMRLVWALCVAAAVLAAARLGLLKRFIAPLNLPPRLLGVGTLILAVNAALPVVYRVLHESKFGTKPDWGAAYWTNQYVWWLLVPALFALTQVVPVSRSYDELWPRRRWLPLSFVSLWLTGTIVHLYCLDYVYDFDLRPDLLAPAIWVLSWVLYLRVAGLVPELKPAWKGALWALPALATLFASLQPGKQVFLTLTLLNVASFGAIYVRQRTHAALHLLLISLAALIAGLPEAWGRSLATNFSRENFVFGGAAVYLLVCIALSRDPKLGFLGSLVAGIFTNAVAPESDAFHWAVQVGLAFLLVHSLRWTDSSKEGTSLVRWVAAVVWVAHAFTWAHLYGAGWRAGAVAVPVLGIYFGLRWLLGRWGPLVVVLAAAVVLLSAPAHSTAVQLQSTPPGLLAVLGSFLLFGLGTLAALTKHRWHPQRPAHSLSPALLGKSQHR